MQLTQIPGVGNATQEKLKRDGYEELADFKGEDPGEIADGLAGVSSSAIENVVKRANEKAITIQSGDEVKQSWQDKTKISTGMPELDRALGGGYEEGMVVGIGGEASSGKTQLAFQSLVAAVEETGQKAVYLETERGRYRGDRIEEISNTGIQSKIYKVSGYGLSEQERAYSVIDKNFSELSMLVVDSFTARFRLGDDFQDRSDLNERGNTMGRHLEKLESLAQRFQIPVLLTCQIYEDPSGYGNTQKIWGGSKMHHILNYVLKLKNKGGALRELELTNHPNSADQEWQAQINGDGMEIVE